MFRRCQLESLLVSPHFSPFQHRWDQAFLLLTREQGNTFPPLSLWSGGIIVCCLSRRFLESKYISLDLLMTIANFARKRCGECFLFLTAVCSVIRACSFQLFVHLQKATVQATLHIVLSSQWTSFNALLEATIMSRPWVKLSRGAKEKSNFTFCHVFF